jgi:type I restriction enzyme M protein
VISTDPQHSRATRKARGQFFTPQQVAVSLLRQVRSDLDLLGLPVPKRGPVLDPACGDGSFLSAALAEGWVESASDLFGFDIDGSVLAGPEGACLTRGDALLEDPVLEGRFAAAFGNPPYGGRGIRDIDVVDLQRLGARFESWRLDKEGQVKPLASSKIARLRRFPVAVLFVERFVRAVRPGGIVALLLPESLFCNRREAPLRAWLLRHCQLLSVTALPDDTFAATGTRARTSFVLLRRRTEALPRVADVSLTEEVLLRRFGSEAAPQRAVLSELQETARWDPEFHEPHWLHHIELCKLPLVPLGEFISTLSYGAIKVGERPQEVASGGSLYVTQRAVADWGVDLELCPRIRSLAPFDSPRYRLTAGDLVLPRCGRGTLGRNRLTRFDGADVPAVVDCFTDRVSLKGVSSAWVLGVLRSPLGWDQIRRTFNGVGTPNLSFAEIRELLVPVPSDQVQNEAEELWSRVASRGRPFSDLAAFVHSSCGLP